MAFQNIRIVDENKLNEALGEIQAIPSGGTSGQVLKKKSNTDYDVEWVQGGGDSGSIITITDVTAGDFEGDVVTATKGTYSKSAVVTNGLAVITGFTETGTVTITATDFQTTLSIPSFGNYSVVLFHGIRVWGFHEDFNILDPDPSLQESRISYPVSYTDNIEGEDVTYYFANSGYEPIHVVKNYNKFYTVPGSYGSFLTNVLKNKPYMVNSATGKADYELDHKDYTKKLDGTASGITNPNYPGGPFAWIELPYRKEIYDNDGTNGGRTVMYSWDPAMKDYGFTPIVYNEYGYELKGVWIPMFKTDTSGKMYASETDRNFYLSAPSNQNMYTVFVNKINSFGLHRMVPFGGPIILLLRDISYMLYKTVDKQHYMSCGLYDYNPTPIGKDFNKDFVLDGSGYTYDNVTIYDEYGIGFQGCTDPENHTAPGKLFHSCLFGTNTGITDMCMTNDNTGNIYMSDKLKLYTSFNLSNYVKLTNFQNLQGLGGSPTKYVSTPLGSVVDLTDNSATDLTGLCETIMYDKYNNAWGPGTIETLSGRTGITTASGFIIYSTRFSAGGDAIYVTYPFVVGGWEQRIILCMTFAPPVDYEPS